MASHVSQSDDLSFPKSRIQACLFEGVHPAGIEIFEKEGYPIVARADSPTSVELTNLVESAMVLGIRSKTKLTSEVLEGADRLLTVGAYCIGTDQIDLTGATKQGIAVFNAPYSNTRSVVELAIGAIIMLSRQAFDKSREIHEGVWNKSAKGACEVRGKTLGIIGYGNIGAQLSVLAEAMGMRVLFFDLMDKLVLGNAVRCSSLDELLEASDYVSLHVDGRSDNFGMFGAREFGKMRPGSFFLNLARGRLVDLGALRSVLESDHLAGAAVDVYPEEPAANGGGFSSGLEGLRNVILTPHIGGSTAEAQKNIAEYVSTKLVDYVNTGSTAGCVNLPELQIPPLQGGHRFLHIHRNVPGVLAQINQILAGATCNVLGQYLKTNQEVGYVISDVDKEYDSGLVSQLRGISETIRFRVLY